MSWEHAKIIPILGLSHPPLGISLQSGGVEIIKIINRAETAGTAAALKS